MSVEAFKRILIRDLATLSAEVRAYKDQRDLWLCPKGIVNPAGTLVLHLTGNVLHFVGAALGQTGYVRDREAEFGGRNVERTELEERIGTAIDVVKRVLDGLDDNELEREYPLEVGGRRFSTDLFLAHLAAHMAYHLGQVDYHRRVVTRQEEGVGAQSIVALQDA
jgi:hypothetical protein